MHANLCNRLARSLTIVFLSDVHYSLLNMQILCNNSCQLWTQRSVLNTHSSNSLELKGSRKNRVIHRPEKRRIRNQNFTKKSQFSFSLKIGLFRVESSDYWCTLLSGVGIQVCVLRPRLRPKFSSRVFSGRHEQCPGGTNT